MTRGFRRWMGLSATMAGLVAGCGEAGPSIPEASLADILATRGAGDAALQQDRLEDARDEYQRLVEMTPTEAAGYAGLGLAALKAADYETAEENLLEALDRAPEDPELVLALATLRIESGDFAGARELLDGTLAADPAHARSLWARADLEARAGGSASDDRVAFLARLVAAAPGNLAALADLADAYLARGELDAALGTLESLRQIAPDFRDRPRAAFEAAEDAIRQADDPTAISFFADFRAAFEVTAPYQAGLEELRSPGGPLAGVATLDFSFLTSLRIQEPEAVLAALRYTHASELAGLEALDPGPPPSAGADPAAAVAVGDFDGDGDEDLLWSVGGEGRFLRVDLGRYVDASDELGTIATGDAATRVARASRYGGTSTTTAAWTSGSPGTDPACITTIRPGGSRRSRFRRRLPVRAPRTTPSSPTSTRTATSTCWRPAAVRTASTATTVTARSPRWRPTSGSPAPRTPTRGPQRSPTWMTTAISTSCSRRARAGSGSSTTSAAAPSPIGPTASPARPPARPRMRRPSRSAT